MNYKNFYFAHAATNNRTDHSDLEFIVDGKSHIFTNIPAPEGWDGESDWTDDEEYVMKMVTAAETPQQRYDRQNREQRNYLKARTSARSFIRNKATAEDLNELMVLIQERMHKK